MPRRSITVSFPTFSVTAAYLLLLHILAVHSLSLSITTSDCYDYYNNSIEPSMSPLQATSSTNIIHSSTKIMDDQSSRSSISSASNDNTTSTGASSSAAVAAVGAAGAAAGSAHDGSSMQNPNALDGSRRSPIVPAQKLKNFLAALNFEGPASPVVNENRRTRNKSKSSEIQGLLEKGIDSMMKQGKVIAEEAKTSITTNKPSTSANEQQQQQEKQRRIRHRVLHGTVDLEDVETVLYFDARQEESSSFNNSDSDDGMDEHHQTKDILYRGESIVLDNILLTRGGGASSGNSSPYTDDELDQLGLLDDDGDEDSSFAQQPTTGDAACVHQQPTSSPTTSPTTAAAATAAAFGAKKKNIPKPPPPPPQELPLRFLRAGKGDPVEGIRRYKASLAWRKANGIDTIMRQPVYTFDLIQQHYPAFIHGRGRNGEPCYYEQPPKTNLKALRDAGVTSDDLLHHYAMMTEYLWGHVERDDLARSIYIIDLYGIRFGDFVGEVVDFVKKASEISSQHYPERAGYVFVIHVPAWFKLIWSVVKPWIDPVTLDKIKILRGEEEVKRVLQERIPYDQLPRNYGGAETSPALGESQEMLYLSKWIAHNNEKAKNNNGECPNNGGHCPFCEWTPARSY